MNQHIQKYTQAVKNYLLAHKKDIQIAAPMIILLGVLVGLIVLSTLKNAPNIVYQPVKACELLTPAEAQDLLGEKVNSVDTKDPVITKNVATNKCSYTDLRPTADEMTVAAVAVQSGINDTGVAENKAGFFNQKPASGIEEVKDLGDSAYFNQVSGQLNILDGKKWIILSYGVGSTPEANTLDKALELAHKVIN